MDAQTTTVRGSVALRPSAFTADALAARGFDSLTAAARACGLAPSTLARLHRGEIAPGDRIIAALTIGLDARFDDLFVITR